MKIDETPAFNFQPKTAAPAKSSAGSASFAEMVAASAPMVENDQPDKKNADFELIRERGFRAYAEEVEKEKMSQLREKILHRMGLSEADLERMPTEQRDQIERLIAQEIQRRMQANAEADNDDIKSGAVDTDLARAIADPAGSGGAGAVMLSVLGARDCPAADGVTRSDLPGNREEGSA
ncbi:MAG: hypothetical protein VW268_14535 [Rhodospirillaceae bacterium]